MSQGAEKNPDAAKATLFPEVHREPDESYYLASSGQLMWRNFRKHKLAVASLLLLAMMYVVALLAGFVGPYGTFDRYPEAIYSPPTRVYIWHDGRIRRPFVYGFIPGQDPETLARTYETDFTKRYPVKLFQQGDQYKLVGLFRVRLHLFGVDAPGRIFLFGTDALGRDVFSRTLQGAQISLTIGLVGIAMSFVLGCIIGGVSGYFGGAVDMVIQRIIEFLGSIPNLPLWMALAAAVPIDMPPVRVYFMITMILSIVGWTGLARTVRGKILQLRVEDYVLAATFSGATEWWVIRRHLLPGFMSYLIVSITLSIPGMILGETALSFLGIGLRPPVVSWGVMLQDAQNVRTVAINPWLLLPGLAIVITVLAFNFVGDGLRDAADPYKH